MYIDPKAKVFRHLDRVIGWQQGDKPAPVTVEWDLSNRCALGCMDCHFAHTHVRGPWASRERLLPMAYDSTGDLADPAVVLRTVREMARAGVHSIVWSGGGEPTTHPDWMHIVTMTRAAGLKQGMYTFGGLLTPTSAAWLASHLAWVVVSLDAADATTYAAEKGVSPERFEAACNGVRWLADAHTTVVGVSFLLHGGNWMQAPAMLALARSLGATYTTFRPAIRTSVQAPGQCVDDRRWITRACEHQGMFGKPLLAQLSAEPDVELDIDRFRQYRDWSSHGYDACRGIRLNTTVTPDGRVWLCPQRRGIGGSCLGNVSTESFGDIWARHPGQWTDFAGCRAMCRLHPVNQAWAAIDTPRAHEAFI